MQTGRFAQPWRTLAILVGGVALTLAIMFALAGVMSTLASASLVLFGIALSFAAIAIAEGTSEPRHWSYAPAGVFSLIGWIFLVEAASLPAIMAFVWPVLLIAFFTREVTHSHHHTPAIHA